MKINDVKKASVFFQFTHKRCGRSNWALRATMMVLSDIKIAPTAGESMAPVRQH